MFRSTTLCVSAMLLTACSGGEAEPLEPEILMFMVEPAMAPAGTEVTVSIEVHDFNLDGPGHQHEEDSEDGDGGGSHHADAEPGHVHIYWNDLETNPLEMLTSTEGPVTIPVDAEIGLHTIIARLHTADHLIVEPQVTADAAFEVLP